MAYSRCLNNQSNGVTFVCHFVVIVVSCAEKTSVLACSCCDVCIEDLKNDLVEDSPEECRLLGVPDLPSLPCLESRVPHSQFPSFLYVCEFLHLFSDALKIKHSINTCKSERELGKPKT